MQRVLRRLPQHEHCKILKSSELTLFFSKCGKETAWRRSLPRIPSRILGHVDARQPRLHDQKTVVQVQSLTAVPHYELCRSEVLQNQEAVTGTDVFTREWLPDSWSKEVFKMANSNVFAVYIYIYIYIYIECSY